LLFNFVHLYDPTTTVIYTLSLHDALPIYRENVGIKDGFVGVSGLSMGGITTNALMTTYPWINAGVCLMGSPKPVKFAKKLVADAATQVKGMPDTEVDKQISALEPFDLSLNLEKLASRPLHFWHGTADKMVPYQDTVDFYRENIGKSYTENVTLTTTENAGHKVSQETTLEMANKFDQRSEEHTSELQSRFDI